MSSSGAAGTCLRLLTLNIRKLSSSAKVQQLLTWAEHAPYDIYMFQECATSVSPFEWSKHAAGASVRWAGQHFWCAGTAHSKGCLTLIKQSAPVSDVSVGFCDPGGRILRLDFEAGGREFSLLNVYGPAQVYERAAFIKYELPRALPDPHAGRLVLIGGDLNVADCALDRCRALDSPGNNHRTSNAHRFVGSAEVRELMAVRGLVDAWRSLHEGVRDFSFWSSAWGSGARLDRWLVPEEVMGWGVASHIIPAAPVSTDHLPVTFSFELPNAIPLGKRQWRLPVPLLDRPQVKEWLQKAFEDEVATHQHAVSLHSSQTPQGYHRARWHRLKLSLVSGLRVLQDEMGRAHRNTLTQLLHSAHTTRTALTTGAGTADPWLVATKAIADHHAHTARQATTASTVLDQLYGDKATVFFNMDMLQWRKGRNQKDLAAAMQHAACSGKKPGHSKLKT